MGSKLRGTRSQQSSFIFKRNAIIAIGIIGNFLLLNYVYLELFKTSPADFWLKKIKEENSHRYETYYKINRGNPVENPTWTHHTRVLNIYYQLIADYTPENKKLTQISSRCQQLKEFDWLHDNECRAWWMAVLTKEEVVDIGIMLGFPPSEHKLGALQLIFKNGMKAWYKPCGLTSEYPENEVIASGIDFLSNWKRTPPAVMRNFTVDHMNQVLRKTSWFYPLSERHSIIDQTAKICSHHGQFRGAFIGWWTGLKDGVSLPKNGPYFRKYKSKTNIRAARLELSDVVNAEEVHNHIFLYLLHIMRKPGKNEFVYKFSPNENYNQNQNQVFLGIDLDRTNLIKPPPDEPTFCDGCKFANQTLHIVDNLVKDKNWFGEELKSVVYTLGGFSVSDEQVSSLYERLTIVNKCVKKCIERYGQSQVIIPDEIWTN